MKTSLIRAVAAAAAVALGSFALQAGGSIRPDDLTETANGVDLMSARERELPEAIIAAYFAALRSGDSATALDLIDPGIPQAERALLADRVLDGSGRVEDVVIMSDGDSASSDPAHRDFVASYAVNGETVSSDFGADQTGSGWVISGGYTSIELPGNLVANGMRGSGKNRTSFTVFPGTYAVKVSVSTSSLP